MSRTCWRSPDPTNKLSGIASDGRGIAVAGQSRGLPQRSLRRAARCVRSPCGLSPGEDNIGTAAHATNADRRTCNRSITVRPAIAPSASLRSYRLCTCPTALHTVHIRRPEPWPVPRSRHRLPSARLVPRRHRRGEAAAGRASHQRTRAIRMVYEIVELRGFEPQTLTLPVWRTCAPDLRKRRTNW